MHKFRSKPFRLGILLLLFFGTSCNSNRPQVIAKASMVSTIATTTTVATTTIPRASRSQVEQRPTIAQPKISYSSSMSDDFWWRLSHNCECSGGSGCANSGGWFQFKGGTARAVGYFPGASYEQQLGMAKWWLIQIKGQGGSRSGWPICW